MTLQALVDWTDGAPTRSISARKNGKSGYTVTLTEYCHTRADDRSWVGFGMDLDTACKDALCEYVGSTK